MAYKAIITDGKRFRNVCAKFKEYNYGFVCHTEYNLLNADIVQQAVDKEVVASVQEISLALGVLIGRSTPTDSMYIDVYVSDNSVSDELLKINVGMYNVDIRVHKTRARKESTEDSDKVVEKETPKVKEKEEKKSVEKKDILPPVDIGQDEDFIFEISEPEIPAIVSYSQDRKTTTVDDTKKKRKYTRHFSEETLALLDKAKDFTFREGTAPHIHFTNKGLAFLNDLLEHSIPMTAIATATGISPTCIHDAKRKLSMMAPREIRALYNSESSTGTQYDKDSPNVLSVCKNLRGRPLSGDYVKDVEQALWVTFDDEDKKCFSDAFNAADSFKSFCSMLNASSFSYKKEICELEDVYDSLCGIKKCFERKES